MSKVGTKLGTFGAVDMYHYYVKLLLIENPTYTAKRWKHIDKGNVFNEKGDLVIDYTTYKKILSLYNKKAAEHIIQGYTLDLLNGLGNLFIARVERPANSKRMNMGASNALKKRLEAEGTLTATNWIVYFVDDDFISSIWHKGNRSVINIRLYQFKAAAGQIGKGFMHSISKAVRNNPVLKAIYPYLPTKRLNFIKNKLDGI